MSQFYDFSFGSRAYNGGVQNQLQQRQFQNQWNQHNNNNLFNSSNQNNESQVAASEADNTQVLANTTLNEEAQPENLQADIEGLIDNVADASAETEVENASIIDSVEEPAVPIELSAEEKIATIQANKDKQVDLFNQGALDDFDPRALALANEMIEEEFQVQAYKDSVVERFARQNNLDVRGEAYSGLMQQVEDILGLHENEDLLDSFKETRAGLEDGTRSTAAFFSYGRNDGAGPLMSIVDASGLSDNPATNPPGVDNPGTTTPDPTDPIDGGDGPNGPDGLDIVHNDDAFGGGPREVVILSAHDEHTIGNLLSDAAGMGTQNDNDSRNVDKANDQWFKELYDKVTVKNQLAGDDEEEDGMAVMLDANTGELIGNITIRELAQAVNQDVERFADRIDDLEDEWADGQWDIEGADVNHNGETYKVKEALFRWSSPIVLDLEGDGLEFSSLAEGTKFDIDGDGKKQDISWTKKQDSFDDAFLVLDKNNNGQVDSGKELFGDQNGAADGYEELAKYDTNGDQKIDASDDVYSELKLWADMNADGVVGEGEMKTLEEMGVTSISTAKSGQKGQNFDKNGNDISLTSTFKRMVNGEEKELQSTDVFFIEKNEGKRRSALNHEVKDFSSLKRFVNKVEDKLSNNIKAGTLPARRRPGLTAPVAPEARAEANQPERRIGRHPLDELRAGDAPRPEARREPIPWDDHPNMPEVERREPRPLRPEERMRVFVAGDAPRPEARREPIPWNDHPNMPEVERREPRPLRPEERMRVFNGGNQASVDRSRAENLESDIAFLESEIAALDSQESIQRRPDAPLIDRTVLDASGEETTIKVRDENAIGETRPAADPRIAHLNSQLSTARSEREVITA